MPDFTEIEEYRAKQRKAAPAVPTEARHAVALKMEELTRSDEWNAYLERLAEWRQISERQRDALILSIGGTELVGDDLMRAKLKLQWAEGFLVAIQQAIDLPRGLMAADQRTVPLDNGALTRADS